MKKKLSYKLVLICFFILHTPFKSFGSLVNNYNNKFRYKTNFGSCPSEVAGKLTLRISRIFSRNKSLAMLKKEIIKSKLAERYFLSTYSIQYNPLKNVLMIKLNCPAIISKVHLIKEGGVDGYDALLMSDGQIFDATFQVLLNGGKKYDSQFPYFTIPVRYFNKKMSKKYSKLIQILNPRFRRRYLSEIIVDDDKNLMIILTTGKKPTSVFLGKEDWNLKLVKMEKVYSYMFKNKKMPTIVNLTNLKKIVVKFNHNF